MMKVEELFVSERQAIAITSMARVGRRLYLGLTGGARILAEFDLDTKRIQMADELFPWVTDRGYCSKLHNALGVLADGSLLLGEGNHFTWFTWMRCRFRNANAFRSGRGARQEARLRLGKFWLGNFLPMGGGWPIFPVGLERGSPARRVCNETQNYSL